MVLLALHLALVALFILTRWTQPSALSIPALAQTIFKPLPPKLQQLVSLHVTPSFILTSTLTSMVIGMLCARSLHYQFYAYVAWSTPFLLWRAGLHPFLMYTVWAFQEWAWNVYPSTETSSKVVVGCLAVQVLYVWWASMEDSVTFPRDDDDKKEEEHIE